jgi:hypothetical protein
MACSPSTTNKCDACFNWREGIVGAKVLDTSVTPHDCKTLLNLTVADCKFYNGTLTTSTNVKDINTCQLCDSSKEYLIFKDHEKTAVCSNTRPVGRTTISNCMTVVIFDGLVDTQGCRMCNKGHSGSGYDSVNHTGSTECHRNVPIAGCEYVMTTQTSSYMCYSCEIDHAVSHTGFSCISFSLDKNCRTLNSSAVYCHYCWHSYYWDQTLCKLSANLVSIIIFAFESIGLLCLFLEF